MSTVSKLALGLRNGEGVSPFVAEVATRTYTTQLPRLLIVEVAQMCTSQGITTQPTLQRAVAVFLTALGERLPHVMLARISILLPLLDIEAYPLRQGVIECLGQILAAEGRPLPEGANNVQCIANDVEDDAADAGEGEGD